MIGVGNVGKAVVRRAIAFGMRVLGNDIVEMSADFLAETDIEMVSKEDLLRQADFVSLNCDLNPTSYHLMSDAEFALMKPSAIVINTARGPIIDELALVKALQAKGLKPGVVSRGYGSKSNIYPLVINKNSSVFESSDEPMLIARATGVPIVIDPNRPRAVDKLLAEFEVDLVLTDDGLQHYRLARDIEIVVVDGQRRFGNGFCLPAGPLREPLTRLKQADCIVGN